ncbi:hypothetical protein DOTSEDRAFT_67997 [Dothistroma septosporum NZE10]|uniref:USP domain-containing protein n=1 Tax=Dothistroma septosporum (strain NZE10 / CBS 128990) TaxID=675120 RepID=N1Q1K2_DOTSN|nr:hypothetical protein DOTSEDRAFT_67997 [Dothistroma septosporum NZE10]
MSAAGPLPAPYPSNSQPNGRSASTNGSGERVFAHIQDLKAEALTDFSPQQSVGTLLNRAEAALAQAKTYIDFRRPDLAFVDYLRAYEIAVEVLPRHKDKTHFIHDQHGEEKLRLLQRRINSMDEQFENIKKIIVNNNSRSGVLPKSQQRLNAPSQHVRAESTSAMALSGAHKVKPSVSPKPEKLHARALSHATTNTNGSLTSPTADALNDRFAKLRGIGQGDPSKRSDSRGPSSSVHNLLTPTAGEVSGGFETFGGLLSSKPLGPRGMPDAGPARPSKLPLDTELAAAMPKAPSPTYSPARNMQVAGNIAPPRHSARSLAGSSSRKSSLAPTPTAMTPGGTGGAYFPSMHVNGVIPGQLPRRKSVHVPKETRIVAERLYDYLERFNILLIDFRSREEFGQGHIFTRNILCVDPLIMRQGISASELADKLVLSPEEEQELFYNRDKFDLVVYYDDHTQSENYISRPTSDAETRLQYLHEALYEFNHDKPLQRPPILLIGGISAWIDLMGNQALLMSPPQAKVKQGRPLQRRPPPRDGPLRPPKRRLREYNPLDPEEEKKWRDRAKSESVPETPAFTRSSEDGDEDGEDEDALQRYPNIDDFNARFPEAGSLGQHISNGAIARQSSNRPGQVPEYPAAPSPSVYPPVPSRPAPAAPRMSYTGVSDRVVSQTTPTTRSSSSLIPYIPTKYLSSNLRLPRTGLVNFGSTCYMNATLQALSATTPLSVLFLDDQFKGLVQKDNWKGSRGLLPDIYANTVRSLWKGDVNCIKPTTLFNFVGRLNSMFRDPGQQQDAQEFFSMIVDVLHEDFNAMWARTPLRALTDQEEQKRERMPKIHVAKTEWGRYTHRENSFLTSLFYGQQSSRLKCPQCGLTSTQYDALALLQVEIPDCREAKIQDCFRQHFKDELLDEDNQWTCPNCKAPRRAWKKLTMTRAPPFLVVGLKRFKTNPRTSDQRKIHTAVRFPLDGLDMEEFMLPQPSPQEAQAIASTYGAEALKTDMTLTPPYMYDAYAVVRHMGESTRSGHYTAAVRDRVRNCWRYFNDTSAQDFDPRTLSSSRALDNDQAYLVFYQRRSPNQAATPNKF